MLGARPPQSWGVGRTALASDSERPLSLVDGQGPVGALRIRWRAAAVGAPLGLEEG